MPKHKISELLESLKKKRMWINFLLGFSAGLPIMLVLNLVKIWARREGVDLTTVGLLGLVGIPYSLNFIMGPFVDSYEIKRIGRRRSWLFAAQVGLIGSIFSLSLCSPTESIEMVGLVTLMVAFFGATQDVAIDAYKREILPEEEIGMGSSLYVYGYRLAMLVTSGGGLWLADPETLGLSFQQVIMFISILMLIGPFTTYIAQEPQVRERGPANLKQAVVEPLKDFLNAHGVTSALSILGLIFFYKFGDSLVGGMLGTFYVDMGYSNKVIAEVTKGIGFFSSMAGLGVGSVIIFRFGVKSSLFAFGLLQCLSTLCFILLTWEQFQGGWWALAWVIGLEDFSSGMGTTALITFMSSMTNKKYTATQYALFASLAALGKTLFGGSAGWLVTNLGYPSFFLLGAGLAVPGLLLILKVGGNSPVPKN
jgi:MFS transporter, PAT family, beta-lactamase induction signal transducer AmpG